MSSAIMLTGSEWDALTAAERIIERGRKTFVEVGAALTEIRDQRLYREDYGTFEEYCGKRWDLSPQHVNRMIKASAVVLEMEPMGSILPETERQARALAQAAPEDRADVWREAVSRNDGQPAPARLVAEVIADNLGHGLSPDRAEDGTPIVRRDDPALVAAGILKKPSAPPPTPAPATPVRDGDEWGTPTDDRALVVAVLGKIDLDPASCEAFNKTIGAAVFYSLAAGQDGLTLPWEAESLYCNPPYSETEDWVKRLVAEYLAGNVREAILLVLAKTETEWFDLAWEHGSVCIVRSRIKHVAGDGGPEQTGRTGSAFFYFGDNPDRFAEVFAHRGRVLPATPWVGRPAEKAVAA